MPAPAWFIVNKEIVMFYGMTSHARHRAAGPAIKLRTLQDRFDGILLSVAAPAAAIYSALAGIIIAVVAQ